MSNYHHNHNYQHRPRGYERLPGKRLPDRWNIYDNVGRDIDGTRFVPFKTPLDSSFFDGKNMPVELQFGVKTLISLAQQANKQIGLVIDLTNTDRYYKKTEWADHGVKYLKLNCPGHEVNEREDLVQDFINAVKEFVNDKENDGKLIGVHCTHGLNRTGYLICRYMIDVDNYSASDAISMFEYYRGHPMEREHYKKSLYEAERKKKYGKSSGKSSGNSADSTISSEQLHRNNSQ
ncbi:RNA/RNP complex-1-interacting phosphatase homolog [Caenorhabditis elegans]|uniref:RNA/RNP complex-1-interacting phosphatase homolog n=1 Tax=Caenorhabditis elegans TaxID=6239 RepID=DUS11_CAEEL|nr:RNA/RNP complex-1-interacting phosphatase homolog [Caenorhabditis elegans]Q22707.2 RecName: Full=RNA/RNP complex-1-interacting phosphatase homolog; AltName: Full=Dual specificity protein phosphatase 11 homolog; AltName: Full=Phosphatase interacting with RNA/RNP complex-1 [Caenorhabditis elegans]CAA92703.2 RNA/RNP complex-1-interacting phosphatase homolog [Caenorhabditis elegans]|eukprot:NP_495959.2 RNA/RNP complex-1-interacting phosphatase homolog [Caenorhabditis elegans]